MILHIIYNGVIAMVGLNDGDEQSNIYPLQKSSNNCRTE